MICYLGTGKYIYFETSDPVNPDARAILRSATIKANSPLRCMTFAYHMRGDQMGSLELEKRAAYGSTFRLFYNHRSDFSWKEYSVNLYPVSLDYQVRLILHSNLMETPDSSYILNKRH